VLGIDCSATAAIQVIGGALPKLTERRIIGPADPPLMRHLHAVVARDQPLRIPWTTFFGGEA
jgi:glycerol-3-phosphate dehydrogenase (NAD(P)+)